MKRNLLKLAALASIAAGLAVAQTAQPPAGGRAAQRQARVQQRRAGIADALNLTDAQKQQARTIFQDARQSSQPLRQQLKENRRALADAAKSGKSAAEIQQLSSALGSVWGQMAAIRTEAFSKFYATLTPEQRAKADAMQQQLKNRLMQQFGQRRNG